MPLFEFEYISLALQTVIACFLQIMYMYTQGTTALVYRLSPRFCSLQYEFYMLFPITTEGASYLTAAAVLEVLTLFFPLIYNQ